MAAASGTAERFGDGNSTSRVLAIVADTAGFFVGKQAATGWWRVMVLAVSARCNDRVVHSASAEGNQASLVLTASASLHTAPNTFY